MSNILNIYKVACIKKCHREDPTERITHLGGIHWLLQKQWYLTQDEVIEKIESGQGSFYVERPQGDKVSLVVRKSWKGNKYVKTEDDGDEPNNLLSLPECLQ